LIVSVTPAVPPSQPRPWTFLPVTNFEVIKATLLEVATPGMMADFPREHRPAGTRLISYYEPEPLLQASARLGFKNMTVHYLDKMLAECKLQFAPGQRPITEPQQVTALMRHAIEECTDDDVAAALAFRGKTVERDTISSSILTVGDNLSQLEHSMDADDYVFLKGAVKESLGGASSANTGRNLDPARPWTLRPMPKAATWTLTEARKYLPKVRGCTLAKDVKRFSRWTGMYPRKTPPFYCTKSWGDETKLSQHTALIIVLKQMWIWHEDATGEPCLWEFSE